MSNEKFETVIYEVNNQVAVITMNRPDVMNASNSQMRSELFSAFSQATSDDDVRAIVLAAAGRGFCVGQDLVEGTPAGEPTRVLLEAEYKPLLTSIDQSEKLVICAVNGPAAGVGSALAMVCDLVVMADNAYFLQAFLAIGLIPDGGACWQLVNQLGYRQALQMVLEGKKISAERCVALGLANRVVAADNLLEETVSWAETIAEKAPLAVAASKRALKDSQRMSLSDTISMEAKLQAQMTTTADAQEGTQAFLEKRKPVFKGQ